MFFLDPLGPLWGKFSQDDILVSISRRRGTSGFCCSHVPCAFIFPIETVGSGDKEGLVSYSGS